LNEAEKQTQRRIEELSARAAARGCWTNTEFLTTAEQDLACRAKLDAPCRLVGGYEGAERRVAQFGSEALCGYEAEAPIVCLLIAPLAPKFAEALCHRDFLGSLMGLGVRREVLGDILIQDTSAYLFCLESIADYIAEQLVQVRRTPVTVSRADGLPPFLITPPEKVGLVVGSERLDALTAAVWKLSRAEGKKLVEDGRVFVNSRLVENPAFELKSGDMVSVRGYGRFLYEGAAAETRKGRLHVEVRIY